MAVYFLYLMLIRHTAVFSLHALRCHVVLCLYLLPSFWPLLLLPVSYTTTLYYYLKWDKITLTSVPFEWFHHIVLSTTNESIWNILKGSGSSPAVDLVQDHQVRHCFTVAIRNYMLPCFLCSQWICHSEYKLPTRGLEHWIYKHRFDRSHQTSVTRGAKPGHCAPETSSPLHLT